MLKLNASAGNGIKVNVFTRFSYIGYMRYKPKVSIWVPFSSFGFTILVASLLISIISGWCTKQSLLKAFAKIYSIRLYGRPLVTKDYHVIRFLLPRILNRTFKR